MKSLEAKATICTEGQKKEKEMFNNVQNFQVKSREMMVAAEKVIRFQKAIEAMLNGFFSLSVANNL